MYQNTHDWEQIQTISEDFYLIETPIKNIEIKRQAIEYLGIENKHLNRTELRLITAKAHKIKNSFKKEERHKSDILAKHIQNTFNHE
jgi:hypothetical protein